jgi:putative phosphoesterase
MEGESQAAMIVGLVSNTNGRADAMAAAVATLRDRGADLIVHCGDVGGRQVLDELKSIDAAFVWGDRDQDRMGLLRHARTLNVVCFGVLGELDLDGKRAVLVHGDDKKLVRRLLDEQQYDYLLSGHDSAGEDRKVGRTRVINPGWLTGGPSQNCALVSTTSDEVKFLTVERPSAEPQPEPQPPHAGS